MVCSKIEGASKRGVEDAAPYKGARLRFSVVGDGVLDVPLPPPQWILQSVPSDTPNYMIHHSLFLNRHCLHRRSGVSPPYAWILNSRSQNNFSIRDPQHLSQLGQAVGLAAGDEHLTALKVIQHKILPPDVEL